MMCCSLHRGDARIDELGAGKPHPVKGVLWRILLAEREHGREVALLRAFHDSAAAVGSRHAFARQKRVLVRGTVVIHLGRTGDVCAMRRARRTRGIARPAAAFGLPSEFHVDAIRA